MWYSCSNLGVGRYSVNLSLVKQGMNPFEAVSSLDRRLLGVGIPSSGSKERRGPKVVVSFWTCVFANEQRGHHKLL